MATVKKNKCPMCHGSGSIEGAKNNTEARQRRQSGIAKKLRDEGYTFREIMALMGYKSTQSVQNLLK